MPVDHAKKNRKAIAEASKRNALLREVCHTRQSSDLRLL